METKNVYVPEVVAKNFKCALCQKYLFVPPVTTQDGSAFRCGRCSFIETQMNTPVYGFEKLASYMAFPCTFRGCPSKLAWEEVPQHEMTCRYRIVSCPCYHCDETFPINKIIQHFDEQHKKYICMNQCCIQNRNIKEANRCLMRLLINNGKPYIMFNYRDNVHFFVSVYSVTTPKKNINFNITFSASQGNCSIVVSGAIVPFNEQEHCINCLDKECKSKFHKYSLIYKGNEKIYDNMTAAIKIDNVVNTLGTDTVNYSVQIIEKMDEDPIAEIDSKKDLQLLIFLQNLECQVCKMLMSAPIYNCKTGHTICKVCHPKLMKCPQCQQQLTDSRCFALEDIADKIKLDCKNKKMGCKFTGNIDQNIDHEKVCKVIF